MRSVSRVGGPFESARGAALPNVPTMAEAGISGQEFSTFTGIVVPAGTPKAIVDKLQRRERQGSHVAGGQGATRKARFRGAHSAISLLILGVEFRRRIADPK
jgi:tripartite-type tricarboxylate transporter receptor subunit TctC